MDQNQTPYADAIKDYANKHYIRLGTPGHQTSDSSHPELTEYFGRPLLGLDVQTLVDGIDIGPFPTPLDQAHQLAAQAWGAHRTWFLTNGASMGNIMACLAIRATGENVVLQRSVHSSVIDGLAFSGLAAQFIHPSVDTHLGIANGITPEQLRDALISADKPVGAYIVSPSYFGAVSDIAELARVAHEFEVPLIVDEAWGSHVGFHPDVPHNALFYGADIVISSTHKLAGSLSQSAMLHLGKGRFTDTLEPLLDRAFNSLQSTSVNSILLASLDIARMTMSIHGEKYISHSLDAMNHLREDILRRGRYKDDGPELLIHDDVVALDPLRIAINMQSGGISGYEAKAILFEKYRIHCELATGNTLLMLCGAGVVPNIEVISNALHELPRTTSAPVAALDLPQPGETEMTVRAAYFSDTEIVPTAQSVGRISADSLAAYPPGIPNLLPGEVITKETIDFLLATINAPFGHIRGGVSEDMSSLRVVKH